MQSLKHQLFFFLMLYTAIAIAQDQKKEHPQAIVNQHPKVLYDGDCGWAIYKGYRFEGNPNIYIVRFGDTIRFYNEQTKKKWLRKQKQAFFPKREADRNWLILKEN